MVVIEFGYKKFVLPRDKAMLLIDCLEGAEVYEEKYWSDEKRRQFGMDESYTYHVYANDANFSMQIMSDGKYQMAKLAGKPTKE